MVGFLFVGCVVGGVFGDCWDWYGVGVYYYLLFVWLVVGNVVCYLGDQFDVYLVGEDVVWCVECGGGKFGLVFWWCVGFVEFDFVVELIGGVGVCFVGVVFYLVYFELYLFGDECLCCDVELGDGCLLWCVYWVGGYVGFWFWFWYCWVGWCGVVVVW